MSAADRRSRHLRPVLTGPPADLGEGLRPDPRHVHHVARRRGPGIGLTGTASGRPALTIGHQVPTGARDLPGLRSLNPPRLGLGGCLLRGQVRPVVRHIVVDVHQPSDRDPLPPLRATSGPQFGRGATEPRQGVFLAQLVPSTTRTGPAPGHVRGWHRPPKQQRPPRPLPERGPQRLRGVDVPDPALLQVLGDLPRQDVLVHRRDLGGKLPPRQRPQLLPRRGPLEEHRQDRLVPRLPLLRIHDRQSPRGISIGRPACDRGELVERHPGEFLAGVPGHRPGLPGLPVVHVGEQRGETVRVVGDLPDELGQLVPRHAVEFGWFPARDPPATGAPLACPGPVPVTEGMQRPGARDRPRLALGKVRQTRKPRPTRHTAAARNVVGPVAVTAPAPTPALVPGAPPGFTLARPAPILAVQASVTRLRGTVPRRLLVVAPVPPTRCTRQARRPTAAVRDPGAVRAVRGRLPLSPFLLALILVLPLLRDVQRLRLRLGFSGGPRPFEPSRLRRTSTVPGSPFLGLPGSGAASATVLIAGRPQVRCPSCSRLGCLTSRLPAASPALQPSASHLN